MKIDYETLLGLELFQDELVGSIVLHIPHSSTFIPEWELSNFDSNLLSENVKLLTDWKTDDIFQVSGVKKIVTPFSRLFCDVERLPDNEEPLYKIGRGFYYTHGFDGKEIRSINQSSKDRIYNDYYIPHHNELVQMVESSLDQYGICTIIDCHSFNEEPIGTNVETPESPDICIGIDEYHTPPYLLEYTKNYWSKLGYDVRVNNPYTGCIIPTKYYSNNQNVKGIMIEFNKRLYMKNDLINVDDVSHLNKLFESYLKF